MKNIKIIVTKKVATVEGTPIIICGNSDYSVTFIFDDEWNNEQNKVARFSYIKDGLKGFIDMPVHNNTCQVPVLIGIGLVRVGVYAGDLKTTTGAKIKCHKSILCDEAETMVEPFKNLYEKLKKEIDEKLGADNVITEFDFETEPEENQVYSAMATATMGHYILQLLQTMIAEKENTSNRVTVVDEESTDYKYPTAKAVYEFGNQWYQAVKGDLDELSLLVGEGLELPDLEGITPPIT